jgi:hypothetical protein
VAADARNVLAEARRFLVTPVPATPLSPDVCAAMVPVLLEQRRRLAGVLVAVTETRRSL